MPLMLEVCYLQGPAEQVTDIMWHLLHAFTLFQWSSLIPLTFTGSTQSLAVVVPRRAHAHGYRDVCRGHSQPPAILTPKTPAMPGRDPGTLPGPKLPCTIRAGLWGPLSQLWMAPASCR